MTDYEEHLANMVHLEEKAEFWAAEAKWAERGFYRSLKVSVLATILFGLAAAVGGAGLATSTPLLGLVSVFLSTLGLVVAVALAVHTVVAFSRASVRQEPWK